MPLPDHNLDPPDTWTCNVCGWVDCRCDPETDPVYDVGGEVERGAEPMSGVEMDYIPEG